MYANPHGAVLEFLNFQEKLGEGLPRVLEFSENIRPKNREVIELNQNKDFVFISYRQGLHCPEIILKIASLLEKIGLFLKMS